MNINDKRFYTDILGISDTQGEVPKVIVDKHRVALDCYRKRGLGGVPDTVMMMIAVDYTYQTKECIDTSDTNDKTKDTDKQKAKTKGKK